MSKPNVTQFHVSCSKKLNGLKTNETPVTIENIQAIYDKNEDDGKNLKGVNIEFRISEKSKRDQLLIILPEIIPIITTSLYLEKAVCQLQETGIMSDEDADDILFPYEDKEEDQELTQNEIYQNIWGEDSTTGITVLASFLTGSLTHYIIEKYGTLISTNDITNITAYLSCIILDYLEEPTDRMADQMVEEYTKEHNPTRKKPTTGKIIDATIRFNKER